MTDDRELDGDALPPAEVVVARLRPHARRLFWPAVLVVVVCAGAGFGTGIFREGLAWINAAVVVVALVLIVTGAVMPLLRWLGQRYVVTTRRLVLVRGLLVRTRQELLHSSGYAVIVRRAGLQTLFRSGDVILDAGLERPLVLTDVPSADLVLTVLHDLMEANRASLGSRWSRDAEPSWADVIGGDAQRASGHHDPLPGSAERAERDRSAPRSIWIDRD